MALVCKPSDPAVNWQFCQFSEIRCPNNDSRVRTPCGMLRRTGATHERTKELRSANYANRADRAALSIGLVSGYPSQVGDTCGGEARGARRCSRAQLTARG